MQIIIEKQRNRERRNKEGEKLWAEKQNIGVESILAPYMQVFNNIYVTLSHFM